MPPAPYLLCVRSRPTNVSPGLWKEMYVTEHLPDLVRYGVGVVGTLYEEIPCPGNQDPKGEHKFMSIYQTQHEDAISFVMNAKDAPLKSERLMQESTSSVITENGEFVAGNYILIKDFDPKSIGQQPSPEILTVETQPSDHDEYDAWYREEHLQMLSRMPGYRRTLMYRKGVPSPLEGPNLTAFLSIHEVDNIEKAFRSEEAKAANATEGAKNSTEQSRVIISRGWRMLSSAGF